MTRILGCLAVQHFWQLAINFFFVEVGLVPTLCPTGKRNTTIFLMGTVVLVYNKGTIRSVMLR